MSKWLQVYRFPSPVHSHNLKKCKFEICRFCEIWFILAASKFVWKIEHTGSQWELRNIYSLISQWLRQRVVDYQKAVSQQFLANHSQQSVTLANNLRDLTFQMSTVLWKATLNMRWHHVVCYYSIYTELPPHSVGADNNYEFIIDEYILHSAIWHKRFHLKNLYREHKPLIKSVEKDICSCERR